MESSTFNHVLETSSSKPQSQPGSILEIMSNAHVQPNQAKVAHQSNKTGGQPQVVIIGAGMSGLSTGLKLAKLNYDVVIVEARDRVGGRIHTLAFKTQAQASEAPKANIDLGASFLHGIEGNPLVDLMKEFGEPVHFEDEEEPIAIYSSEGPALPEERTKKLTKHAYHTFFNSARTDAQATEIPDMAASLGSYLYHSESPLFDVVTGPDDRHVLSHLVGGLESWTGAALENVSLRWWGFERDFGGKDGVVKEGYGVLANKMANEFIRLGGTLMLGYECLGVQYDPKAGLVKTLVKQTVAGESVCAQAYRDGLMPDTPAPMAGSDHPNPPNKRTLTTLTSSYCCCTLPLGVLKSIVNASNVQRNFFNPPLPARRCQAIERTGFGLLNKVILRYDHAWWPIKAPWLVLLPLSRTSSDTSCPSSLSLSNSDHSSSSEPSSGASPRSSVWPSPTPTKDSWSLESTIFATSVKVQNYVPITGEAALVFFFGASAGEAIEEMCDEDVAEMMHAKLLAHLDSCETDELVNVPNGPSECIVTRWNKDRFARGSYAFIPPHFKRDWNSEPATPLDMIEMSRPLWNGRLGWAGEHCQADHYACVHGSYMSGVEEAERIHVAIQASAAAAAAVPPFSV